MRERCGVEVKQVGMGGVLAEWIEACWGDLGGGGWMEKEEGARVVARVGMGGHGGLSWTSWC